MHMLEAIEMAEDRRKALKAAAKAVCESETPGPNEFCSVVYAGAVRELRKALEG